MGRREVLRQGQKVMDVTNTLQTLKNGKGKGMKGEREAGVKGEARGSKWREDLQRWG